MCTCLKGLFFACVYMSFGMFVCLPGILHWRACVCWPHPSFPTRLLRNTRIQSSRPSRFVHSRPSCLCGFLHGVLAVVLGGPALLSPCVCVFVVVVVVFVFSSSLPCLVSCFFGIAVWPWFCSPEVALRGGTDITIQEPALV